MARGILLIVYLNICLKKRRLQLQAFDYSK